MPTLADDDLVQMYGEGDSDAFDALFDRHHAAVYNFARMMLGRADGADDVLQDVFLAVARAARAYQPRGRFRAWLLRLTRNHCLNRLQSERLRRRVLAEGSLDIAEAPSGEPSPPEQLDRDERLARLRVLIAELPERQREAIVLYAFEQMSYQEIGDVLGMPINTVKTLIHRARAALARRFEEETPP